METSVAPDFTGRTALITPEQSAAALVAHLGRDDSGSIWDVSDAPAQL